MRIGMFAREFLSFGSVSTAPIHINEIMADLASARDAGLDSFWLPQQVDLDALMVAPWLSAAVPELEIGVGVVPMRSVGGEPPAASAGSASTR